MPCAHTPMEKSNANTMDLYGSDLETKEECFNNRMNATNNNIPLITWAYTEGGYIYNSYI